MIQAIFSPEEALKSMNLRFTIVRKLQNSAPCDSRAFYSYPPELVVLALSLIPFGDPMTHQLKNPLAYRIRIMV